MISSRPADLGSSEWNCLTITLTAILAGGAYVRGGIEELSWTCSHRDGVIQENEEVVQKIVDIVAVIGGGARHPGGDPGIMGITRT